MRPLRELGEPIADLMGPLPVRGDAEPARPALGPGRAQLHQGRLAARARRPRDRHAGRATTTTSARPSRRSTSIRWAAPFGRVPAGETAFGDRSAPFLLNSSRARSPRTATRRHVTGRSGCTRDLDPALTGGAYINFLSNEGRAPRPRRVRRGHLRAPGGAQARVRPDQPVPAQPEHPADRLIAPARPRRRGPHPDRGVAHASFGPVR